MSQLLPNQLRHQRALASCGLNKGTIPQAPIIPMNDFGFFQMFFGGIFAGIIATIVIAILEWLFQIGGQYAQAIPFWMGALITWIMWLHPWVYISYRSIFYRQKPSFYLLRYYSIGHRWLAHTMATLVMIAAVCSLLPSWQASVSTAIQIPPATTTKKISKKEHTTKHLAAKSEPTPFTWGAINRYLTFHQFLTVWFTLTMLLGGLAHYLSHRPIQPTSKKQRYSKHLAIKNHHALPFGLWLGKSTGNMASLSHNAAIAADLHVALFGDDAAQNIVILGAIGSGKTTRAMHPLLMQLLDQQCGGLIFDIKGDFKTAADYLSHSLNRHYSVIGHGSHSINLIEGLTPEIASSCLKSALTLSNSNKLDSFWLDTATELCRNALGILSFLPDYYNLQGLYRYLFEADFQKDRLVELTSLPLNDAQYGLLSAYQHYEQTIFNQFDDKVKAGVKATVAQILAPFNHPDLVKTFCTSEPAAIKFESLLDGQVFLIDLPLARWGLGGKVAYTFIKLRFFNLMQQRSLNRDWDQTRYVFFLCDEYQEIVSANKDGLSDLNFWDKSRSSKTIGIISAQSVSSFYAAIGDRDLSHALLQNFRQKICFRTEDQNTIDLINRLLGTVEIQRVSHTQNSGTSSSGFLQSNDHSGTSVSFSTHDKRLLDGQFFRTLSSNYALALLSIDGRGTDDVLKVDPIFIPHD